MCGIAGVIGTQKYTKSDVARMIDCIAYRGPDEQDVVQIGPALLGHARLAVVDPENGGQPMSNTDDTVWVVFNGEIYNFIELREDLKSKGYQFKSRCDTEVLVHLWREKGVAMLDDLIGMFAFCLWDTKQNKGILARDRQGIKPCYLMDLPDGGFAFGSEIKTILSLPGISPEIDDIGVNLMHSFNYCPPPRTCYKGITHLAPGTYLEIAPDGSRTSHQYWSWPIGQEAQPMTHDAFGALLDDAIRLQMRFDVKGCLFLSGGVDSSVIAAHLRHQWNAPSMLAFGLDCREEGYGEYHLAQQVAAQFDTIDLHPIQYDHSIVPDNISAVLHHADQPHGDFSFFLIRRLCQAAHEAGVIVAMNGDGPDEVLSGFSHNQAFFNEPQNKEFPIAKYFDQICFMPEAARARVLNADFRASLDKPIETFEEILAPWGHLDPVDQIAAYECTSLSPGNNLIKTDRMGAGQSIEGRSPFMDHRVSEALARLPLEDKMRDGVSKLYLKDYGLRHFDRDLMFRKKSMPTMPIGEWIKGPLEDWARDTLATLDPSRYNVAGAVQMFEDHKGGKANHTRELRTLLMSAHWMRQLAAA
ncbi:asparagine synthase (glutamine-hydrolyzing) [Amylibacter sp. IMCC11727]|uniref:asparagine synthase (glutamine-hydrolyzing) n=1 Tax=Amylibacter sp. IMCC11727 TaxID=3039851 RepID=UPI00244E32CC|nr:asparagine synthase (glutamine-hydrolyzing) [Amylibacter sp. IMCC11727]WGI22134.1 asparagine synthase (glutamine-hydrolyzing) [Amylibacter sp. IMCC11727]